MSILDTLITDRTLADVQQGRAKGYYNYTDLDRVGTAQLYVQALLAEVGADNISVLGRGDWTRNSIYRRADMERYLADCEALRAAIPNDLPLPASIRFLDYVGANQIEELLLYLADAIAASKKEYLPSGSTFAVSGAAEIRLPQR